jgi:putative tryptophan/tyrosine transport system substrate-binding protein
MPEGPAHRSCAFAHNVRATTTLASASTVTLPAPMSEKFSASERPFWIAMSKKGWVLGRNFVVEPAFANWRAESLASLAEELVRKRVDLILPSGPGTTLAAARATRTIPIVFAGEPWPVEQGFIDSFARPGRNLTGYAWYTGIEVSNKRVQFLREIVPTAERLSWLWAYSTLEVETVAGDRVDMVSVSSAAAKAMGFKARFHVVQNAQGIEAVFREFAEWRAQAFLAGGAAVWQSRQRVAELALRHRLPSAFHSRDNVEAGGLLSYEPPEAEWDLLDSRRVDQVDRILRGASPADMPVEQPSRYELVVNAKTAKALGLTIPPALLARTDEIIR